MATECDHIIAVGAGQVIRASHLSPLELMRLAGAGMTYKYCADCGLRLIEMIIEMIMEEAHANR